MNIKDRILITLREAGKIDEGTLRWLCAINCNSLEVEFREILDGIQKEGLIKLEYRQHKTYGGLETKRFFELATLKERIAHQHSGPG